MKIIEYFTTDKKNTGDTGTGCRGRIKDIGRLSVERRYIFNMKKVLIKIGFAIAFVLLVNVMPAQVKAAPKRHEYGVFIGADKLNYQKMGKYDTVVIDADYFSAYQIEKLKKAGCKRVYTYLNIGSIEEFRSFYDDYKYIALDTYDNWPGEYWMDISNKKWQDFCIRRAAKLKAKGVDGFFIDNCDVYYQYPYDDIYKGLCKTLSGIRKTGGKIIINGGDTFVTRCIQKKNSNIFDGVNQETVYTSIDFEHHKFGKARIENRKYFTDYLKKVKKAKKQVYVLEYAKKKGVISKAKKYAKKNGWRIYVSSNLELK